MVKELENVSKQEDIETCTRHLEWGTWLEPFPPRNASLVFLDQKTNKIKKEAKSHSIQIATHEQSQTNATKLRGKVPKKKQVTTTVCTAQGSLFHRWR